MLRKLALGERDKLQRERDEQQRVSFAVAVAMMALTAVAVCLMLLRANCFKRTAFFEGCWAM